MHGQRFIRMLTRLTVTTAVIGAAAAGAAAAADRSDSVCVHFTASSRTLYLELKREYTVSGTLPLTLCNLAYGGTYRVAVDGTGLERRIGTCRIDRSGRIRFGGIRLGAFLRNGILPGWGSVYAERKAVGLTDGLMLGASLYALYTADQDYRHLRNRFDTLSDLLAGAGTLDEIRRIQEAAYEASRDVNTQNAHRTRLVYLSAFLYGHQVLEPFLAGNPPRMESKAEGNVVEVASGASTRFKAFVYSMLRPGRGQFYQGKTTRGVLFSTMSTVAAFLALDFHNRYDEGVVDYELAVARYDAAATVGEKVRWSEAAATAWDDLETEKHRRDAAYITLAGLWGLSLADALIPGGGGTGAGRYAFDVGCGGCALVMRF